MELLEKHEIDWIDQYHSLVWNILNPRIEDPTVKEWYVIFLNMLPSVECFLKKAME